MTKNYKIVNANIVNEGKIIKGDVIIRDGKITGIYPIGDSTENTNNNTDLIIIDATGKYLLPGVIDDQVHFREPGLTHKGDIYSESKAAVAGGITSYMEMPNTVPQTLTQELLENKYQLAKEKSLANYSFYMGVSNDNADEVLKTDATKVCGIKIFLGASTGNMLVNNIATLEKVFSQTKILIAVHCEDEDIIKSNTEIYKAKYGEDIPFSAHPLIRSKEACYTSSYFAYQLAKKHNSRLHLFHLSTADEMNLLDNTIPLEEKRITAEVCVHHLWFTDKDYDEKGAFIKWNPAIKTEKDRDALFNAVLNGKIDVIATDHAPHTIEEKQNKYLNTPSGGPLVQHSLVAMLEFYQHFKISIEKVVEMMCHNPARLFRIDKRGYIRIGYHADLVLVDLNSPWTVDKSNVLYKCGWSPFEGETFFSKVTHTFVNGNLVFENGVFDESIKGERLTFNV